MAKRNAEDYIQPPDLSRVHAPLPGCTLHENEERLFLESDPPPAHLGKPFEYCGAWCIDVPEGATSLVDSARELSLAMPKESRQRMLLLAPGASRSKFASEISSLLAFDIGEREAMLQALRDGRDAAKKLYNK